MLRALLVVALCGSAIAQTAATRVLSTIVGPSGTNPSGRAVISWNRFQNDANPRQTVAAGNRTITITAGVVDVSLFPTTAALPMSCYTVQYTLNGQNSTRYWTVPVSPTSVTLNVVESSIPCPPPNSQMVSPGQLTDGGASSGQVLTWNGRFWAPADGGGSGGSPGGSSGQIQYNNLGAFGGFTMGGDCAMVLPNIICTKTNGTSFAPSATIDTTNASNITSGTLAVARGGTGAGALTTGSVPFIGAAGVYSQDNARLFWDSTNFRLGLGTNTPETLLHLVGGDAKIANARSLYFGDGGGSNGTRMYTSGNDFSLVLTNTGADLTLSTNTAGDGNIYLVTSGNVTVGPTGTDEGYKVDVQHSGVNGTMRLYDQTPTTGVTQQIIRAGAGQNAALTTWRAADDDLLMNINGDGTFWKFTAGEVKIQVGSNFDMYSGGLVRWFNGTNIFGASVDVAMSRNAAGVIEINNGTPGTYRDLTMRNLTSVNITGSGAFDYGSGTSTRPNLTGTGAARPATCSVGQTYFTTDAVAGANIYGCTAANTWTVQTAGGGGGSGPTLQTNSVSNASQTTLNLLNSAATNGLTLTLTNASGGNVQLGYTGTLNNSGITNPATTVNGNTCTLGSTCTLTLASSNFVNQGSTTTVLHGNAAGNPGWSAISLTADVTGILPVANGGTGTSTAFTTGAVVLAGASGVYTQDPTVFFWDATNNRLGIGNAVPAVALDVTGDIRASANFIVTTQAEPTCNSGNEGKINYISGGSGANSQLRVCGQLSDDSYSWIPLI